MIQQNNLLCVLGAPIISAGWPGLHAPQGHAQLYKRTRKQIKNRYAQMVREYVAIFDALRRMGQQPRVLLAHEEFVVPEFVGLFDSSSLVRLPDVGVQFALYPRDLATVVGDKVLLNSDIDVSAAAELRHSMVSLSVYGEGGRWLQKNSMAVGFNRLVTNYTEAGEAAKPSELVDLGLRVSLLPNAASLQQQGRIGAVVLEDHIDRVAGLVGNEKKSLHLVVDPAIYSLQNGRLVDSQKTLDQYKKMLDPLEISVVSPKKMIVPGAVCFHQFQNGQVLLTGGDDEMAILLSDLVGTENVFVTEIPIQAYVVSNAAGIRCLINELPDWFLQIHAEHPG